jgi:S1-C subfamily serine protease
VTVLLAVFLPVTTGLSARAENALGYRLLSVEEAARLPSNHGSLGMSVERSRQIQDSGMTFEILRIRQIRPNSPAAKAGFRPDDQIIAVDGRVFTNLAVFGSYIGALAPGSQATIDYMPAGEGPSKAQRVTVALAASTPTSSGGGGLGKNWRSAPGRLDYSVVMR